MDALIVAATSSATVSARRVDSTAAVARNLGSKLHLYPSRDQLETVLTLPLNQKIAVIHTLPITYAADLGHILIAQSNESFNYPEISTIFSGALQAKFGRNLRFQPPLFLGQPGCVQL